MTVQSGSHDDTDPGAVRLSRSSPTPGTVVIGVGGELDAATEPTARTFTTAQLVHRPGHVIVDVSEVTFLGSAGLRWLLDLRDSARGTGFALHLAGVAHGRAVELVLRTAELTTLFGIGPSAQDVLDRHEP
ncbi:MAG: Anti-anti-sigma factor [Pseudonocardia sp.]|uniref:STAS domain-containing protein n=1 Tax=Pseudonocardia sp. TaxID=60912 RepID=UPI002633AE2F|nr:STAS domain-containing protein [Pseudonocardia sp.]MCU1626849.1 Anti-anti-sigma factor [Pseudonocardia sp.]MDT7700278.1 anti-sigma factor antagonist [Pseudonocardiales bacterium]